MGVSTITTNVYECDYCHFTSESNDRWFQVWVINVTQPQYFHTASCALNALQAANVAPEINIIIEDTPEVDPTPPEPEPQPVEPVPVEPLPEPIPDIEPATPEVVEPEPEVIEPEPEIVIEEEEIEPPLDPDEPQPAE